MSTALRKYALYIGRCFGGCVLKVLLHIMGNIEEAGMVFPFLYGPSSRRLVWLKNAHSTLSQAHQAKHPR